MLEDIEETLLDIKSDQGNMGSLIQQRRHELHDYPQEQPVL